MNKSELIVEVAEQAEISKKDATNAVNAVLNIITDELAEGGRVALAGFGIFETRHRPERVARNPQTQETLTVPATVVPKFKVGAKLRRVVAGEE